MSDDALEQRPRLQPVLGPNGLIEPGFADIAYMALVAAGLKGSRGLTVCFHGPPGDGKTSMMEAAVRNLGLHAYVIDMTRRQPEDVTGIPRTQEVEVPMLDDGGHAVIGEDGRPRVIRAWFTIKMPDITWETIAHDPNAVMIFDDSTNIPWAVQAAMLDILADKRFSDGVGGWVSLKHAPALLAGNYGEGSALTPFLAPFANRIAHVVATERDDTDYARWIDQFDLENHPERLDQALNADLVTLDTSRVESYAKAERLLFAKYFGLAMAFVAETRGGAHTRPTPQDFDTPDKYAFASNRSYELAARWLAVCEHFGVEPMRMLGGCIGEEKAGDFMQWMRVRRLVKEAIADRIDWSALSPSEQGTVSLAAAERVQGDGPLTSLLRSFDRLQQLAQGSEDPLHRAREVLIKRARGQQEPRLTRGQQFAVRSRFPQRFVEIERAEEQRDLDWKGKRLRGIEEAATAVLAGEAGWASIEGDDRREVAVAAARRASSDPELTALIGALRALQRLEGATSPAADAARDLLIDRALGREPALTERQAFLVRSTWRAEFKRKAGPSDDLTVPGVA